MDDGLIKAIAGLREEMRALRDDLYNTALLTGGDVFATAPTLASGQHRFVVADMPPLGDATAGSFFAYRNESQRPVVAIVRAEPHFINLPPIGLGFEQSALLLSIDKDNNNTNRATIIHISAGASKAVLLRQNESLFVSVMASGPISASWRVVALRGRRIAFEEA